MNKCYGVPDEASSRQPITLPRAVAKGKEGKLDWLTREAQKCGQSKKKLSHEDISFTNLMGKNSSFLILTKPQFSDWQHPQHSVRNSQDDRLPTLTFHAGTGYRDHNWLTSVCVS